MKIWRQKKRVNFIQKINKIVCWRAEEILAELKAKIKQLQFFVDTFFLTLPANHEASFCRQQKKSSENVHLILRVNTLWKHAINKY